MSGASAFVALGSNAADARARLEQALVGLEAAGVRVAAVAPPVTGPYLDAAGRPVPGARPVLNTVAQVTTALRPQELLAALHALEDASGRVRDGGVTRTLDLDLLTHGERVEPHGAPILPHPRAHERAFVLAPWREIAPWAGLPGTGASVALAAARLEARHPAAFDALRLEPALRLPALGARPRVLPDRAALRAWRDALPPAGAVGLTAGLGLVPTMGALHAGHAALVRRARSACDAVLATIFVNPLQFGPGEDLARYPRTLESDLDVLAAAGADAVYLPDAADLYPPGFATTVTPEGPALPLEGERRPGHFRGVATVVLKLFQRTRPARAWFGQKDAQQVAVLERLVLDLDLSVALEVAPIVRDDDGLALSSRNRYLAPEQRARALALPSALAEVARAAARGERDVARLLAPAQERLVSAGLQVDYLEVVDPRSMQALARVGEAPALALATIRAGSTRLLDNRWVVVP